MCVACTICILPASLLIMKPKSISPPLPPPGLPAPSLSLHSSSFGACRRDEIKCLLCSEMIVSLKVGFLVILCTCVFNLRSCHLRLTLDRAPLCINIIGTYSREEINSGHPVHYWNNMSHGQNLSLTLTWVYCAVILWNLPGSCITGSYSRSKEHDRQKTNKTFCILKRNCFLVCRGTDTDPKREH